MWALKFWSMNWRRWEWCKNGSKAAQLYTKSCSTHLISSKFNEKNTDIFGVQELQRYMDASSFRETGGRGGKFQEVPTLITLHIDRRIAFYS